MTYEENLRNTAEELQEHYNKTRNPFNLSDNLIPFRVFEECAAYCLKKQAEAYSMGFFDGCGDSARDTDLQELGLIP